MPRIPASNVCAGGRLLEKIDRESRKFLDFVGPLSAAQVIVCSPKTISGLSQFLLDQIV